MRVGLRVLVGGAVFVGLRVRFAKAVWVALAGLVNLGVCLAELGAEATPEGAFVPPAASAKTAGTPPLAVLMRTNNPNHSITYNQRDECMRCMAASLKV